MRNLSLIDKESNGKHNLKFEMCSILFLELILENTVGRGSLARSTEEDSSEYKTVSDL